MARARNIKPAFFKNEDLAELPFDVRLMFIGLWTLADREGRLEDRPKRIKMELFPADDVDVDAGLWALQERGFIIRYEADNQQCIQVVAFAKHQAPHIREAPSALPAPEQGTAKAGARHDLGGCEALPRSPESLFSESLDLNPSSLNPESLQNTLSAAPTESGPKNDPLDNGFAEFWDAYPKKVEKKAALAAWKAKKLNGHAQEVIDHVRQRATQDKSWLDGYIPSPKRFIRDERWKDEFTSAKSHRERVLSAMEDRTRPIIEGSLSNG
jgi:hypothetical protein